MAKVQSLLAGGEIEVEDELEGEDLATLQADVIALRAENRRLKMEIQTLTTERDSAEQGERTQRVRADRAERMCDSMNTKCEGMQGEITGLRSQLDEAMSARMAAEAVGTERAIVNERLISSMPTQYNDAPLMDALRQMQESFASMRTAAGAPVAIPAFELSFKRDSKGTIQSPVTATPKGM